MYTAQLLAKRLPKGKVMKTLKGKIFVTLLAGLVLFNVISYFFSRPNLSSTSSQGDKLGACIVAEKFVAQQLKSPSTAEFPPGTSECRASQNGSRWTVSSYVDSENGFGAMIRSDYSVEMQYNPDRDNFTLIDTQITSR
jgi:hypothetical protein